MEDKVVAEHTTEDNHQVLAEQDDTPSSTDIYTSGSDFNPGIKFSSTPSCAMNTSCRTTRSGHLILGVVS